MAAAGLRFAGSADIHLNFIDLAAPGEFHPLLRQARSRDEFESTGDFIRNQRFRKDVYIKAPTALSAAQQQARLAAIPVGTIRAACDFARNTRFNEVALAYRGELFEALIERLADGAASVDDLGGEAAFDGHAPELLVDAIKFLVAGGEALPFRAPTLACGRDAARSRRFALPAPFNAASLKRALFKQPSVTLAAPKAGIAMEVSTADALYALCAAEAPADRVAAWADQRVSEADQEIAGAELDSGAALGPGLERFRETRLAKFIELGILEPARG